LFRDQVDAWFVVALVEEVQVVILVRPDNRAVVVVGRGIAELDGLGELPGLRVVAQ
jgi:hypothetical protein